VRVVAARRGQVRQAGAEEEATGPAPVLGVNHAQLARPVAAQAADLMQGPVSQAVAWAGPAAARARAPGIVPRAALLQWCRQALNTGDALGRVRGVFARSHARSSGAVMPWKAQRDHGKRSSEDQLPCYSLKKVRHFFGAGRPGRRAPGTLRPSHGYLEARPVIPLRRLKPEALASPLPDGPPRGRDQQESRRRRLRRFCRVGLLTSAVLSVTRLSSPLAAVPRARATERCGAAWAMSSASRRRASLRSGRFREARECWRARAASLIGPGSLTR
jgi:hypothetical protein